MAPRKQIIERQIFLEFRIKSAHPVTIRTDEPLDGSKLNIEGSEYK